MNLNEILQQVDKYYEENKGEEAEKLMMESIAEAVRGEDNESLLHLLNELLGYYRETSQLENSFAIARQALSLAENMGLHGTIPYATTLLNVANAYRAGGRLQDSLQCYEEVRQIYERTLSPDNMLVASLENNISLLYQEMGDFAAAKESLLRALLIVKAKDADFEVAVTYANLAGTCMGLGEAEEASAYAAKSIKVFDTIGVKDAHYGAALAAQGSFLYKKGEYQKALSVFQTAMELMERSLGRNEYYYRLRDHAEACEAELAKQEKGQLVRDSLEQEMKQNEMQGLELCRQYYETFGKPMIEKEFPDYADKIAVGLVGMGSDCFGYDDEISRDHDWGPNFCMWVTDETYAQIGSKLQEAYERLPEEFMGYHRTKSARGDGRRGVLKISEFYQGLLGTSVWEEIDWQQVEDASLAAAVNGEVFCDEEGIFTGLREKLMQGYPEWVLFLKVAESAARFAQTGQYNYARVLKRGDTLTAQIMLADCIREAMKLQHYIDGVYPPHDKWLLRSMRRTGNGRELADMLQFLQSINNPEETVQMIERIAEFLALELYAKNFISDTESYLDVHTEELLQKSAWSRCAKEELVEKIARLEFEAFDKVQNVGGRASCQNNWPTFSIMRKSQYLTWNRTMLMQYLYDFTREYNLGHNLITEKYGRMMESTAPEEYESFKDRFPEISSEKKSIIEQIVQVQVAWMEEFAAQYPHLADQARSVRSTEDNLYNTSYETYLRGEISTYSDKMLELYGRYVVEYAAANKNIAFAIMENSAHLYGYESLDAAERFLGL